MNLVYLFVLTYDLYKQAYFYVQDHVMISIQKNFDHVYDVLMNMVMQQKLFYVHVNVNILYKFQYHAMKMYYYHN